jgi:hypothetical protein
MHTSSLALATFVAVASGAPASITLRSDEVILHGQGQYQIIKRSDLTELNEFRANHTVPPIPGYLETTLFHGPSNSTSSPPLTKRAESTTLIIPAPPIRFLGWDVQMSEVVHAGDTPTRISITSGYDISNSVSVSSSATFTLVKDFLQASLSIDYSTSWTSSQSQQFSAEVPAGKYGAFVSNPWTNRQSGHVFEGVVGEEGSLTYYQGDSFEARGFGGLEWVDGVIGLCVGDEVPLKRCLGEGTL